MARVACAVSYIASRKSRPLTKRADGRWRADELHSRLNTFEH